MSEDQLRANVRQTAVDAERHWWVTRLRELSEHWKRTAVTRPLDPGYDRACVAAAGDIDDVIRERSK